MRAERQIMTKVKYLRNLDCELIEALKDLMAELTHIGNYSTETILAMNQAEALIKKAESGA